MKRWKKWCAVTGSALVAVGIGAISAPAWTPVPVKEDPLVRMPGTQPPPENAADIEAPTRCLNCHAGFDTAVEPGFNWKGSMMAQAALDFLYWSCLTVAAQDSIWAVGRPNATDICLRCHMPKGWLQGRSDPTNGSAMVGHDFDGVQCDFCHSMFDPFASATHDGSREGGDWLGYWDETNQSGTPSQPAADLTLAEDLRLSLGILLFNGGAFYQGSLPPPGYTENAAGQYFVDDTRDKRASFADANARHPILYSRYHKSRYFCSTCHDVSNPVLANLGADPTQPLPTETASAHTYFHVERTFSEFMLSDYGRQGGAPGIGPYDPAVFETSRPMNYIAACQDCHMRDGVGRACSQNGGVVRPAESVEHPKSGQPIHDLTGGNAWVSWVLASAVSGSPNYDAFNAALLNASNTPDLLTIDLNAGVGVDPAALLAGADRAMQQLRLAAAVQGVSYDPATGALSFRIQNQTGHKLISGFPEGRRMFVNIRAYQGGSLVYEVNPYDAAAGTLKGLHYTYADPDGTLPAPAPLGPNEAYVDALVYELHPSSSLTGEAESFHFALATGRYKDNRIPPKGFRVAEAAARLCLPVDHGQDAPGLYTAEEYAGGYDQVSLSIPPGADYVEITLYYQTTSREYVEFLRDEIKGTATTLSSPTPSGEPQAYVIQTDPFFSKLAAWGDTIWRLWKHNMNVTTAAPFAMAGAAWGTPPAPACATPGAPVGLTATGGRKTVDLAWSAGDPPPDGGYRVYYDQAGKLQFLAAVDAATTSYTDRGLQRTTEYCYAVTAWNDCDGDGLYTAGVDTESPPSATACATTP
ncbi:hypothetical protein G3N55_06190 [Dissulfurirhabdus thermomarina]|uniref:Fibronectin type-III domain-containing protein n=1 Tax=Dissulfurirhabdus thermomarina TaxID=1765737 RepID=A0A6N9TMB8_DISTH|nr:hypothetical protein [Dissulfurirhabdus thermomarina]NDY42431.1 hypothetical protein [Dissulfurirhabdus thermomarina]NMX24088.1 hypothetical protein [Dissulfurirhabdus thermomarina]